MTGRVLGLDVGESRIGVALSDPLGVIAQPLATVERVGARKDVAAIARLAHAHEVVAVVVGLPLLLSGEEGSQAAATRLFAERLTRSLGRVSVAYWDERLTTAEVERTMIDAGVRRARRRERVDALAAVLILQGYLDAGAPGGTEPTA